MRTIGVSQSVAHKLEPTCATVLTATCIDLGALGVDPAFQRQGIAARLLKVGLDRADSDGVPIYLEATPDGALMYPKFGFEKVGELSMFDGQYVIESHVRPARTAQS